VAATRLDTSRLSFGEMVAGISAVVLFIALFLPWYGVSIKGAGAFGGASSSGNAWDWYGGRDLLLAAIAVLVAGYVLLRALDVLPAALPFDPALAILVLGGLAVLMVLIGILHIPDHGVGGFAKAAGIDFSRKWGLFLGFLASCGIAYGGWAAYNESRRGVVPAAAGPDRTVTPPATAEASAPSSASPSSVTPSPVTPSSVPPAAASPPPPPPPQQPASPPADWYPDPHGQARLRWWDGSQWTDQTAN